MAHLHTITFYINYLSHLSYTGLFLVIIASGHVIPVPEAIVLVLLGYISAIGKGSIAGILLVGIATTIFSDLLIYFVSLGGSSLAIKLEKKVHINWIERYRGAEERRLFKLVLVSHFVPGWRLANPIIAGITKMPWKSFVLYTVISSLIYAPIFVGAGYIFHSEILPLIVAVESTSKLLLTLVLLSVFGLYLLYNNHHAEE